MSLRGRIIERFGHYNVVDRSRPTLACYVVRCGTEVLATFNDKSIALRNAALRYVAIQQQEIEWRTTLIKQREIDLALIMRKVGLNPTDWKGE